MQWQKLLARVHLHLSCTFRRLRPTVGEFMQVHIRNGRLLRFSYSKTRWEAIFRSTPGSSLIDISSGWLTESFVKPRDRRPFAGISNYHLLRITMLSRGNRDSWNMFHSTPLDIIGPMLLLEKLPSMSLQRWWRSVWRASRWTLHGNFPSLVRLHENFKGSLPSHNLWKIAPFISFD